MNRVALDLLALRCKHAAGAPLEKVAFLPTLMKGLAAAGRFGLRALSRPATAGAATGFGSKLLTAAGRGGWAPGRIAGAVGGLGLGAHALGNANDAARFSTGRQLTNPLTWGRGIINTGPTHEQAFTAARDEMKPHMQRLQSALSASYGSGNEAEYDRLLQQLQSGTPESGFGNRLMRNLPFASLLPGTAQSPGVLHDRMQDAQQGVQGQYQKANRGMTAEPGDLERYTQLRDQLSAGAHSMPGIQQHALREQAMSLYKRLTAAPGATTPEAQKILQRMGQLGMARPEGAPAAPQPTYQGSLPTQDRRPPLGQSAMHDAWEQLIRQQQEATQHGQSMFGL